MFLEGKSVYHSKEETHISKERSSEVTVLRVLLIQGHFQFSEQFGMYHVDLMEISENIPDSIRAEQLASSPCLFKKSLEENS